MLTPRYCNQFYGRGLLWTVCIIFPLRWLATICWLLLLLLVPVLIWSFVTTAAATRANFFTDKNIFLNQKYFCKSKLTFWLTAAMTSCDQPITGQIQTIKVSLTFRNFAPTQYSTIIKIFWILVFLHLWLWCCLCSFSISKLHQFYKNSKTFFWHYLEIKWAFVT